MASGSPQQPHATVSAERSELSMYRSEWRDKSETTQWLQRVERGDRSLCFPSGMQTWGDVRADIDPSVNPDVVADLQNPPFAPRSFDTVYVDPPYAMCAYDKIHQWLPAIWKITDKRLIVNMPAVEYNLPDAEYQLIHERNNSPTMQLALYHVWDRQSDSLANW